MSELLARISSHELTEWCAVFEIEAEDMKQHELMAKARANRKPLRGR